VLVGEIDIELPGLLPLYLGHDPTLLPAPTYPTTCDTQTVCPDRIGRALCVLTEVTVEAKTTPVRCEIPILQGIGIAWRALSQQAPSRTTPQADRAALRHPKVVMEPSSSFFRSNNDERFSKSVSNVEKSKSRTAPRSTLAVDKKIEKQNTPARANGQCKL